MSSYTSCLAGQLPKCRSQKASHPGRSRARTAEAVCVCPEAVSYALLPHTNQTAGQGCIRHRTTVYCACRASLLRCRAACYPLRLEPEESPAHSDAGRRYHRPSRQEAAQQPAEIAAAPNALKAFAVFRDKAKPQAGQSYAGMVHSGAWVQDFTHLRFMGEEHYLAVVLDLRTRQVVGWRLGTRHRSELTLAAVLDALSKHPAPTILHSDQGTEYLSFRHQELCARMEITLSCSKRASPWQNGFMERWFGNFKLELGNISHYKDLAQLHGAVALAIFYYNTKRIHSALKMSPAAYAATLKQSQDGKDRVLQKMGG
jgi:transposase InsO family protein